MRVYAFMLHSEAPEVKMFSTLEDFPLSMGGLIDNKLLFVSGQIGLDSLEKDGAGFEASLKSIYIFSIFKNVF